MIGTTINFKDINGNILKGVVRHLARKRADSPETAYLVRCVPNGIIIKVAESEILTE